MPAVRELDIIKRGVKHLLPFLAKKLLPDITQQDIQDVVDHELARGASNRYVNVMIGTLRSILRRNHQWERLRADYKKLKEPMTAGKELSYEEEEKLLKECRLSASRVLFLAVILGLYSGLRREEMRLLRWYQIDLQKAFLTVGESKTPHGEHRVVPLIGPALEAMKNWAALFPERRPNHFVFPAEKYAFNANANQVRIYKHFPEKPMGAWKRAWKTACRRASVRFRFHDLRHTTVTRLLDAGCTLEQIAPILGWSPTTMAVMMRRYQHRSLEKRRETMATLVTPRNVDEVSAFLSLLNGNKMNIAAYDEITKAIKKRIEELGGAQLHKDDSNEPTGIGEADFRKAPRDENK